MHNTQVVKMANKNPNIEYRDESYFTPKECPKCKSTDIIKWGFRFNHTTKKRRYLCKNCKFTFVVDDGFWKMSKKREMITSCLDLYMNGMSLRKISTHMKQFGNVGVHFSTVLTWLKKYSTMIQPYTESLPITICGVYHADELFVKCNGEQHYYWDLIDHTSRFLVATHYSTERSVEGASMLFKNASERARKPKIIITDGLLAYVHAVSKSWFKNFYTKRERVQHVRITERNDYRNNIIERIQGTIRERVKVMRGFHNPQSAELILNLFVIWYNFLRVHQGIGTTPAEKVGINLNLDKDKWLNLIYKSKITS
jgi:transposase-like protein